ncbi:MAG: hypothetical protein H0U43_07185 [Chthoniobacterales bacterium]|nr:hypothetical protein [Chthoniobacterales bacterium]
MRHEGSQARYRQLSRPNVTGNVAPIFGPTDDFTGRFTATAESSTGESLDVKVVIDAQKNIFLVTKQGDTVLGGFGTVSVTHRPSAPPHSPSSGGDDNPSSTPSPSPSASPGDNDDNDDDGSGHEGDDERGRHDSEDADEAEDHHEDDSAKSFNATFTVMLVTGQNVTGNLVFSDGLLLGDLTLNGVVYNFRAPEQSSSNHLANISTRGFVNTGQGQLIGGFIITGGPKMVIIRAVGPSLAASGVSPALQDPVLQLFDGQTLIRENDNWQSAENAGQISASAIAPKNPNESAIMIQLEPGSYTTVLTGANSTTGIALVEVYEIDHN